MDNFKGIGKRIRLIRKTLSFSQIEFAKKLGLKGYLAVHRYEKEKRMPDVLKIDVIAALGNTTSEWLKTGNVNIRICDEITSIINKNSLSFSTVADDLGVSEEFLSCLQEHKTTPSSVFVTNLCHIYNIDVSERERIMEIFNPSERENVSYFANNTLFRIRKATLLDQINHLLRDDEEAQKMVLEILKSRKTMNEAMAKLKDNKT